MTDNWWSRWLRFNVVGVLGVGVQLTILFLLSSALRWNYLLATVVAVEATVLHNFYWHQRFTWRDRKVQARLDVLQRLLCFNLTNGAISISGNVVLMYFLVHKMQLPVLASSGLSIIVCSLVNFLVSDLWVFQRRA